MFGNPADASKAGLTAPPADQLTAPPTRRPRPVPPGLVPFLIPLLIVFAVVLLAAPAAIGIGLALAVFAVIAYLLIRTNRAMGLDYAEISQNDPSYNRFRRWFGQNR